MVDDVLTLLKVTAVPGRILEPDVNAVPTSTEVLEGIVSTGIFTNSPVDPIDTESPTATLLVLKTVNTVAPTPAVFPTEIAVSKTPVVLDIDSELNKIL